MSDRERNRLLLVLFIGVLMAALDIAVTGPALPAIRAQFGMDVATASWIFGIYIVANLVASPLLAKASDRFGRRTSFLASVVLFGIGSIIVATAVDVTMLLIGRAIQGFGAGGIFPVATAVVGDVFPVEQRGRALGMIGAVFGIAFLLGPIIGGVLLLFGWQWLFWVNVPIMLLIIGLGVRLLPTGGGNAGGAFDWLGSIVLSTILILSALVLQGVGDLVKQGGSLSTAMIGMIAAVIVLLPVFVWAERRAADPVVQMALFDRRQVIVILAFAFGAGMAEAVTLYLPSLLVSAHGMNESAASFQLIPLVLAMAVASPLSGRVLDKQGAKPVVLGGVALMAAGLLVLGVMPRDMTMYYLFSVLFGFGIAVLLGASLRYMMLGETEPSQRAPAQAILTIVISVGQMIGAALMGAVAVSQVDTTAGYALAMVVTAGVMLALLVVGIWLHPRVQTAPESAPA
ncbi:MAG: MFS transporter [Chloroflexi bacterium]|nr:MAG: MFS transporter [Chloroflexota bacterium]